jgi:hypothetical protein
MLISRRSVGGPATGVGEATAKKAGAGDAAEVIEACDGAPPNGPAIGSERCAPLLSISGTSKDAGDAIETGTGAGMSMEDARNKFSPPKRRAVVAPALTTRGFLAAEDTAADNGADTAAEAAELGWRRIDGTSSSTTMVRPNAVVVLGRLARRTGHDASEAYVVASDASGSIEGTAAAETMSSDCTGAGTEEEPTALASGVAAGETSSSSGEIESRVSDMSHSYQRVRCTNQSPTRWPRRELACFHFSDFRARLEQTKPAFAIFLIFGRVGPNPTGTSEDTRSDALFSLNVSKMSVMVYVIWPLVASGLFLILLLLLPMGWLRPRVNAFLAKVVFFEWYLVFGVMSRARQVALLNFSPNMTLEFQ